MKYVAFTRQSKAKRIKDENGEWGFEEDPLSHNFQTEEIRKYTGENELLVFSETNVSRDEPFEKWIELNKAIDSLKKGDIFIVWKADRLMADNDEVGKMIACATKKGAELISVTEENFFENKPIFRIYRMLAVEFNRIELEKIRERTRNALQAKKCRGERVGYIPYGYKLSGGKYIVPDEIEQSNIEIMDDLYHNHRLTYREVVERMNGEGLVNRKGCPWSRSAVHRILTRKNHHAEFYLSEKSCLPQ